MYVLFKYLKKYSILLVLIHINQCAYSQADSSKPKLQFSSYLETYYLFDLGNPLNHIRPNFVFSHNRHNEINLNLGFIKANYLTENVRANLALATGTYMNANYSAEPSVLKSILEANIGIKLSNKKNIWLDAGILPSHLGFESAISKDCWNLTRSILADNSPYFETGLKFNYTSDSGKWFLSGLLLNGWQRIQRIDGNNTPAFGHQIIYKPNSKITFNSSSFIGNDKPDSIKQMRYFHNFYTQIQATKKLGVTIGFDIGAEQKLKGSSYYNMWYSPVLIARYAIRSKSFLAIRLEYYSDKNGVIISTGTPNGFQTLGYSINYDYNLRENVLWRIEARGFYGKDKIFMDGKNTSNNNYTITTSLAIGI